MKDLENKEIFSKNLLSLMKKHGVSRNKLCDDLGFKYMTVSDWINAKTYPRINKIEMLADYFHVNKSDIIEEKNPSKKNTEDTVIYKDDDFKVFSPTRTVSPAYKPVFGNQLLAMTAPVKEECPEEEEERRPSREEMLDWLKNNIRTAAYGGGNYEEITDDEELYQYYQDVRSEFDEE
ncbi:helix-turn-helix domain-containing protein [Peptoniphilaceae bacterium SGI.097]